MIATIVTTIINIYTPESPRIEQRCSAVIISREFKKTSTATATGASLNERFNKKNNGCARAL